MVFALTPESRLTQNIARNLNLTVGEMTRRKLANTETLVEIRVSSCTVYCVVLCCIVLYCIVLGSAHRRNLLPNLCFLAPKTHTKKHTQETTNPCLTLRGSSSSRVNVTYACFFRCVGNRFVEFSMELAVAACQSHH